MTSVTQVEEILKQVWEIRANELAQETGFVQRERKLSGADFVQILAFGHLHHPQATLSQLTQVAQVRDVQITSSGLHQRCTQAGATFLQAVLAELVEKVVAVPAAPISLFKPFNPTVVDNAAGLVTEDGTMREAGCSALCSFSCEPMRMVSCNLAELLNREEAQDSDATPFSVHA